MKISNGIGEVKKKIILKYQGLRNLKIKFSKLYLFKFG